MKLAFDTDTAPANTSATPIDNIGRTVSSFSDSDDTEGALEYYDEQIALREQDSEEKKLLLIMKSQFARRVGKADIAIQSAEQAYRIEADATTTKELADAYLADGNKEQALVYYKKLSEASSQEGKAPTMGGPSAEDTIKDLEQ